MATVLLIDAEKDFATPLVQAMQGWGYGVTWTPDGKEGLDRAAADRPSAIVLCVELGKMSGYSICNKLKKDDALKDIPLVITSREATNETFEQHKKLKTRAEAYLIKPFKPQELQNLLTSLAPSGAPQLSGDLQPHDLQSQEEDIVLDDLPPGSKEESFDPGALVGSESKEQDPVDALEGFAIAGEDDGDEGDGATRLMSMPAQMQTQLQQQAAKAAAPAPAPKPTPAPAPKPAPQPTAQPAAQPTPVHTPSTTGSVSTKGVTSSKPLSDDERKQMETKLQEAKTKAAASAQEVDKLRAEMNQLRTKAREESAALRAQVQELTEKMKTDAAALKTRYEETTQKAVQEAATLRQQVKDVQTRAQGEIENLRSQLIEIRNQSQDLLTARDGDLTATKKRMADLEAQVETLKAESARAEKIRERTVKAVDVALTLLQEEDTAVA